MPTLHSKNMCACTQASLKTEARKSEEVLSASVLAEHNDSGMQVARTHPELSGADLVLLVPSHQPVAWCRPAALEGHGEARVFRPLIRDVTKADGVQNPVELVQGRVLHLRALGFG